jgi:heme exporter protein C
MSLWEYANPKKFMETSAQGAALGSGALQRPVLVIGLVWGFFFTPDDYKQDPRSRSSICTSPPR